MRIFLTGATGYIGSHVARHLMRNGHQLFAMVRGAGEPAPTGMQPVVADLARPDEFARIASGFDAVGHFASAPTPEFAALNARAVSAVLAAIKGDQAFAMQGGSLVFGDTATAVRDESSGFHPPPFLAQQARLEESVLAAARGSGPRSFVVYASMVHGGKGAMIPGALARAAAQRGSLPLPGTGTQLWSTVHVEDWAQLIAHVLERGPGGGHAYLAAGPAVSIGKLLDIASDVWTLSPPFAADEQTLQSAYGFFAPALAVSQHFSAAKAQRDFGWEPRRNDLAASLKEVLKPESGDR